MRHFKIILPLAFLSFSLFWTACFKDHFTGSEAVSTVIFAGQILDETGQPLPGAQVQAGYETTTTDKNGVFRLSPTALPANDAILKVSKSGYFDFSRAYVVEPDAVQPVTIQLLPKTQIGAFAGSTGGTVQIPGGAQLVFPAGAVNHSGMVIVYARYLDPTDSELAARMPGDLRGINLGGAEQTLATFGMLGVELVGQNGQALQLAAGQEAEIKMPIAASQAAVAPNSIPLWHYDYDKARWIEEGSAQKIGNQYVGKVKHFSFWNCDYPGDLVLLKGKVLSTNNKVPLGNLQIRMTILSSGWAGWGSTNGNGHFGGAVPKGEKFKLEVLLPHLCGNTVIHTEDVGPFSGDVTLPDIIVNGSQIQTLKISGRLVDCNNQPVTHGYLSLLWDGANSPTKQMAFPESNGMFEVAFINCSASATAQVKGYDLAATLESTANNLSFPPSTANLGDIVVCQSVLEFIKYNFDGKDFTILEPNGESNSQTTYIFGETIDASIGFSFNNQSKTGTFPLNYLSVNAVGTDSSAVSNLNTTLTAWGGQPGEFNIGTFGGTFKDWQGQNHSISGSYKVKR